MASRKARTSSRPIAGASIRTMHGDATRPVVDRPSTELIQLRGSPAEPIQIGVVADLPPLPDRRGREPVHRAAQVVPVLGPGRGSPDDPDETLEGPTPTSTGEPTPPVDRQ